MATWSSRRSSAPRHGLVPPDGRAAARHERHESSLRARAEQGKTKNEAARNGDILCARIASKA